jgi:hypothetical protein
MYVVSETCTVSSTVSSYHVSLTQLRRACPNANRRAKASVQGPRLGGSFRRSSKRQALYAGDLRDSGQMLSYTFSHNNNNYVIDIDLSTQLQLGQCETL